MMKIQLESEHIELDNSREYVEEKIGKLDHLLPRHSRRSAHAEVRLKAGPGRGKKQFTCEVVIHLPKQITTTNQTGDSLNSSIDMAEAKLKNQLKKYKDKHIHSKRRLLQRLRRR